VLSWAALPIRTGAATVFASGNYVLSNFQNGLTFPNAPLVINDRTGTATALDRQCEGDALGPPWVLLTCSQSSGSDATSYDTELYSLTDGSQQTVTPIPGVPYCPFGAGDTEDECATPDAVGADWIRWDATCYHCAVTSYFQNIQTGELRDDPTNATTYADLNSPALAHKTCPGVRLVPAAPGPWGSLTYDGQFALVDGAEVNVFLERCGTRMQRPLVDESSASTAVAWNAGAVVWQAGTSQLNGLFLPSLQSFTIPLPAAIVKPPGATENTGAWFVLTSDALYVRDGWYGTLWRTASPTALPLNRSRPRLTRSGRDLTCKRGSWRHAERFSYAWLVNGVTHTRASHTLAIGRARRPRRVSCSVTASNTNGTTTVSSTQLRVR
jgi:hypothetical protein